MLLTVRELIERLAHLEDNVLVATKQFRYGQDTVTLNFVEQDEVEVELIFKDGEDKPTVILG